MDDFDANTLDLASNHPLGFTIPFTSFKIKEPIFTKNLPESAAIFLCSAPHQDKAVKIIPNTRDWATIENEVSLQRSSAMLGLSPNIYVVSYGIKYTYIIMDHIVGGNIYDQFGEDVLDNAWFVSNLKKVHSQVTNILIRLADSGIAYPDRSAYQFMTEADSGRLLILDFEHARRTSSKEAHTEIHNIENEPWNPDFV
jgi:hypothetical protein